MWDLAPGDASPYHWHAGEEEWLVVIAGRATVRTPAGERVLGPWDTAVFLRGEGGTHQVRNESDERVRVLFFATRSDPDVRVYPDDDAITVVTGGRVLVNR